MNDQPISDIKELNELAQAVLRGEDIPDEDYARVLQLVRKVRRTKAEPVVKPTRTPVDVEALLGGFKK
jgi:hypothetical protein